MSGFIPAAVWKKACECAEGLGDVEPLVVTDPAVSLVNGAHIVTEQRIWLRCRECGEHWRHVSEGEG